MNRQELIQQLTAIIEKNQKNHPFCVGIDGASASGKTFLADSIADSLKSKAMHVIRASVDGFHNPKAVRYQKGCNSAEGYYKDSFNNKAIIDNLLTPLGKKGSLQYKKAIFDFKTDKQIVCLPEIALPRSVLIMEGIFLFRPELVQYWDLKIFLDVTSSTVIARAITRDKYYLGSEQEIIDKYHQRYIPGENIYFQEAHPKHTADIVIDNNDFENPVIVKQIQL